VSQTSPPPFRERRRVALARHFIHRREIPKEFPREGKEICARRERSKAELPVVAGLGDVLPLASGLVWLRLGDHVHICEQKLRRR